MRCVRTISSLPPTGRARRGGWRRHALARGEWEEAARRFEEIGSLPNGAFARLQSRETRPQALAFYRSVGAALPELLAAAG